VTSVTYGRELRRCGKSSCGRCQDGPSHGPYWYAYWRDESGRRRKSYCGKIKPCSAVEGRDRVSESGQDPRVPLPLRICLLGGFEVERGGVVLTPHHWPRASARKLPGLLLLHPSGLTREETCEALWPEHAPDASARALRSALSALRSVLDPSRSVRDDGERLPRGEQFMRLHLTPHDWVDIHEFSQSRSLDRLTRDDLIELVALYRGELLPEFRYEDWASGRRETLRSRWHIASLQLARRRQTVGGCEGIPTCGARR